MDEKDGELGSHRDVDSQPMQNHDKEEDAISTRAPPSSDNLSKKTEEDRVIQSHTPSTNDDISKEQKSSISDEEAQIESTPAAAAPPAEPEASRTKLETTIIMLSLCSAVFLAALDTTIVATALPVISDYFNTELAYTWVGSAYLLTSAATCPSWGKFSDIWGRKPVLLIAAVIFFVGSLLSATAVNIGMLLAGRAIQGVGGGGLIVLVNICISDLFSMRKRPTYFGIVGMVWAVAGSVGPTLGGIFTEKVSWRWCFYINLPITATVAIALYFYLHLDNPRTPVWEGLKAVDWAGSLTVVGGTLMLLLGLEFGGVTAPWGSAEVICLIIFGLVVSGLFLVIEWKYAKYPVMPLRLFKKSSSLASFGVCSCHGFVFVAGTYYLPLYFQAVLGATPLLSGVYLLPFALGVALTSTISGIVIRYIGKYLPSIYWGTSVMTLGFGLFISLDATANWTKIILFQIVAGIGAGPLFQAPLLALQTMVAPRDVGAATAAFSFIRNLATAISLVIGGVVFQNEMQKKRSSLVAALGPQVGDLLSGGSAGANVEILKTLPPAQRVIARNAYYQSLKTMWIMYTAFAGLGLVLSLFIASNVLSKEHQVTKTGLAEEEAKRRELGRKKAKK